MHKKIGANKIKFGYGMLDPKGLEWTKFKGNLTYIICEYIDVLIEVILKLFEANDKDLKRKRNIHTIWKEKFIKFSDNF